MLGSHVAQTKRHKTSLVSAGLITHATMPMGTPISSAIKNIKYLISTVGVIIRGEAEKSQSPIQFNFSLKRQFVLAIGDLEN